MEELKHKWKCECGYFWMMKESWKEKYPWQCQKCHENETKRNTIRDPRFPKFDKDWNEI